MFHLPSRKSGSGASAPSACLLLLAAASLVQGAATAAPVSLLPDDAAKLLADKKPALFTHLDGSGAVPDGCLLRTAQAADPVWHGGESSVESVAPVAEGDRLVLTVATRGVSRTGAPRFLVKIQGSDYVGVIRQEIPAADGWQWHRFTGVAKKAYDAGALRLHVYPAFGCQAVEFRGLRLENLGASGDEALPPLPPAPSFGGAALVPPDAPPPPKPVELAPLTDAERAKPRHLMLKLDDVGARNYRHYDRVIRYLEEKGIVAGFGVVVNSIEGADTAYLDWLRRNARENGGRIEFWNHGWDHYMKGDVCEFKGTGLAHQREHLAKSQDVFREKTGITMHTLGTAGNARDADTPTVLAERPDITVWIYGDEKNTGGKLVLRRTFNLEYAVGKIDFNKFATQYQKRRLDSYAIIQGHPNMWNDASFAEFKKVVEQLLADGWTFTTPHEYATKYAQPR